MDSNSSSGQNPPEAKRQRIVLPWEQSKWQTIKKQISEKIGSIVDMDSIVSRLCNGKLKPRRLTEMFTTYFDDDNYRAGRLGRQRVIDHIFPMMQKLVENAPALFKGFDSRVLIPGVTTNLTLTRPQVATLIACMWFGMFNYHYLSGGAHKLKSFPEPLFIRAVESQNMFWLQCILNYFSRVYDYMNDPDDNSRAMFDAGNIIIHRNVLTQSHDWVNSDVPICRVDIGDGHSSDTPAKMHVVYAHEIIGGDMYEGNMTQEEIVLIARPECLITTIFCAALGENESIVVFGAEKMSQYTGMGSSVKFTGNYTDMTPKGFSADETEVMAKTAAIFIDSSRRTSLTAQMMDDFIRDINKAYCGFTAIQFHTKIEPIATGNWSYGFNSSQWQVKLIQQVIAASEAGKSIIYHANSQDLEDQVGLFADWLGHQDLTVGQLVTMYLRIVNSCYESKSRSRLSEMNVFEGLMSMY